VDLATITKHACEVLQELNQEVNKARKVRFQKLRGDFEKLHMLKLENTLQEY